MCSFPSGSWKRLLTAQHYFNNKNFFLVVQILIRIVILIIQVILMILMILMILIIRILQIIVLRTIVAGWPAALRSSHPPPRDAQCMHAF